MRILLAVDGSKQSDAAIDAVWLHFGATDNAVRIISVAEPPYVADTFSGSTVNPALYVQLDNTERARLQEIVEAAAVKLRTGESRRLTVTTDVLSGSPKRLILSDAEAFGADWIVVGSHGHGALEGFLLGSVSQAVALHAACSVAIVRTPNQPAA